MLIVLHHSATAKDKEFDSLLAQMKTLISFTKQKLKVQ